MDFLLSFIRLLRGETAEVLLAHNERQGKVVGCVKWAGRGQQGLKTLPKKLLMLYI